MAEPKGGVKVETVLAYKKKRFRLFPPSPLASSASPSSSALPPSSPLSHKYSLTSSTDFSCSASTYGVDTGQRIYSRDGEGSNDLTESPLEKLRAVVLSTPESKSKQQKKNLLEQTTTNVGAQVDGTSQSVKKELGKPTSSRTDATLFHMDVRKEHKKQLPARKTAEKVKYYHEEINYVDLSYRRLTIYDCVILRNVLCNNATILEINLSHCGITSEGAILLAHGLSLNKTLLHLDLSYNKIEDPGASFLSLALNSNDHILKVNLSHNSINTNKWVNFITERLFNNICARIVLEGCVFNKLNLCILGGQNCGKTSLLSSFLTGNGKVDPNTVVNPTDPSVGFRTAGENLTTKYQWWNIEIVKETVDSTFHEHDDLIDSYLAYQEATQGTGNTISSTSVPKADYRRRAITTSKWVDTRMFDLFELVENQNDFKVSVSRKRRSKRLQNKTEIVVFPYRSVKNLRVNRKPRRSKERASVKRQSAERRERHSVGRSSVDSRRSAQRASYSRRRTNSTNSDAASAARISIPRRRR